MTSYRYVFGELLTGKVIGEVPLYGVNAMSRLNDAGELRGSVNFDQTGQDNQDLASMFIPGRSFVVMEREDFPVWGGIVWSRTYQSQAKVCQMYCRSWEAFPGKQRMPTFVRLATEQVNIFRDLWNTMQADPQRDIGVVVPPSFPTVLAKSVSVDSFDDKYYGDVMSELADADNGFDWTIDTSKVEGAYVKTLRIGYPTLGSPFGSSSVTFEYPGPILNYYETASISSSGTHIRGIGGGEGSSMLISDVVHTGLLANGWLRYDVSVPLKFLDNQAILNGVTAQQAAVRKAPTVVIKAQVKGNLDPVFGSYSLGDGCEVKITDPMHPGGMSVQTRLTQWVLRPQNDEQTEEVDLVFEGEDL